ncbi:MAG: triose-phosphate isomerase [Candidatus Omnitrophica bacterium]|nr:triose-phosphate isomerase [Candidatus Omnitrophota bacterium]
MARKPFIAGNWKMYKTTNEAVELAGSLVKEIGKFVHADIALCPTYTVLNDVYKTIENSVITLGAQNVYWESEGAYTGEISPIMVKDTGAEYVIIGHSERRKYFSETDSTVNKKVKAVLAIGLTPIICIGETLEEREQNKTMDVIKTQLEGGLEGFAALDVLNSVIAYEPIWAIGTGKTATPEQAEEVHAFIRTWLEEKYTSSTSDQIRILYGGSVKPENIRELMQKENIDGALVGGASLKKDSFVSIVKNAVSDTIKT